jgi:outer membrane protein assembly factor BamB
MSFRTVSKISSRQARRRIRPALAVAGALLVLAVSAAVGLAASTRGVSGVGQAPPEWAANAGSWPAHNYDLANTRATTRTAINSANVSSLKVKWRFPLKGVSAFGAFASTPIVLDGTVYFQDLNSNVYAVDRNTGKLRWRHLFNKPSIGPNGIAYGWGRIYGATETNAFALDGKTGNLLWSRRLIRNGREGIDMAPQLYDNTVLFSTVPGNVNAFYEGGALGVVWALDAATGKPKWKFNTISDGARLWGNPRVNSGGGLWYPPAVDSQGRVFLSVANPAPFPGTKRYPNGSSRPGPNLYTDSLVALDGQTGKLLWYRQALPHDLRDYDLQIPAVVTQVPVHGVQTEVVLVAGKMGKVFAYRAGDGALLRTAAGGKQRNDGRLLWALSVGKHQNDSGPLPRKPVTVFPGILGGVETPMALAENRLFVPWLDYPTRMSATGISGGLGGGLGNYRNGRGGFTAVDATSGKLLWQRKLPSMDFGAATVANDVVFTSTYDGTIYAFDTKTGRTLWSAKARAGINSFPAIDGDTLLIGAATSGFFKNPHFELIAYALS